MFSCVYTEERIESCHTAIKPRSMECCSDVCPFVDFSYLHIWSWSSTSDHQVLGHHTNHSPSPSVAQFVLEASSRKSTSCFKLLPLRVTETTFFCEPSMKHIFFWTLPQMRGLTQTCFWAIQAVILTSGLVFYSDIHYQLLDLLLRHGCLSKLYQFNWICHRLPSQKV